MITRKHYSEEFKRKLGLKLAAGITSAREISKREGISATTLYKWRDMAPGIAVTPDEKDVLCVNCFLPILVADNKPAVKGINFLERAGAWIPGLQIEKMRDDFGI